MHVQKVLPVTLCIVFLLAMMVAPSFAQDEITLEIMHWDSRMVEGVAWWDEIVSGFEAAHPGVNIETNFIGFGQYLPTLQTRAAGEELPDVFFGHVMAAELGRAGLAVNYADIYEPEYFERFYPGPLRQFTFDEGAIYALPWTAQMFGIFVNDTIMTELGLEPPNTWDELIEMAPAINEAGYIPLTWGNAEGNVCPDFVLPLITQYGGDVYALDALTDPDVTWDSEPVVNGLALLQRLAEAGVFMPGINGVADDQARQIWFQSRGAMMFTGSWVPSIIEAEAPPEIVENYYVWKLPALTEDGIHWSGDGSGEGWVVNANSSNRDLALELVDYLLSDEVYAIHIAGAQNMPSMPSALDLVENPFVQEMTGWLETDGSNHILFGQGNWDALASVCSGILDSTVSPEDGAAQIQADILATRSRS
jgi:raffinose/stachyose/melibiose transport system substrate-binding protein